MDDVGASDHLITIVDDIEGRFANGLSYAGGKSGVVMAGLFDSGSEVANTGVHEMGHMMGLYPGGDHSEDPNSFMSVPRSTSRNTFSFSELEQVVIDYKNGGKLNQGSNYSISGQSTNNILWHRSSQLQPYDFNVRAGQKIPKIVK